MNGSKTVAAEPLRLARKLESPDVHAFRNRSFSHLEVGLPRVRRKRQASFRNKQGVVEAAFVIVDGSQSDIRIGISGIDLHGAFEVVLRFCKLAVARLNQAAQGEGVGESWLDL